MELANIFLLCLCAVIVAGQDACIDKNSHCPGWKIYCDSSRYKAYMTKYCKKTCGVCTPRGNCGRPSFQESRIVGGTHARKGAWPWQILTLYRGKPDCGGSLVSPNWVVTAAHCVTGQESQPALYTVRVGEYNLSTSTDGQHKDFAVEKIIMHSKYSYATKDYDIALMKLATPVLFNRYVKPVCLPKQGDDVPPGTMCFITGWGSQYVGAGTYPVLQQAKMEVRSHSECQTKNRNSGTKITDNMICAGPNDGYDYASGCHGDSGGPFVCKTGAQGSWVLQGAVSWGSSTCNGLDRYTVFAKVANLRSWIDQQMSSN